MADLNAKIIPLQTEVLGRVPTDAQVDVGEIAINLTDRKIFSKNSAGEIVALGGSSLPGGDYEPIYPPGSQPISTWVFLAGDTAISQCAPPEHGSAIWDKGSDVILASTIDQAGDAIDVEIFDALILEGSFWVDFNGTQILLNDTEPTTTVNCNFTFKAQELLALLPTEPSELEGLELKIYPALGVPSDIPFELKDGDALRYDGTAWRAVDYKIRALDDVDIPDNSALPLRWISATISSSSGGMDDARVYLDSNNIGLHPQVYRDGSLISIQEEFEKWLESRSVFSDMSSNRISGDYSFSTFIETELIFDDKSYDVSISRFLNNGLATGAYRPRLCLFMTRPNGVSNVSGKEVRLPEFEEFYSNLKSESAIKQDSVLQYSNITGKWTAGDLIYELTKAVDFAYQQAPPVTPGWASGDSQNAAEYAGDANPWTFNLQAIGGADRSQLFTDNADASSVWWSADGSSFTEEEILSVTQNSTTATILFTNAPTPPATVYIAFSEPGVPADVPIRAGDILVWNGTDFVPGDPTGSLELALDDLTDVNTITFPPSEGQALVWDQSNNVWRPGSVASDNDTALNDLTDVTVTSPASGQVIKYTGSGFENAALDYSEIANAPNGVSSIGDLSDVDVSTAPVIGQVLVWDGAAWKPEDQTGGEGGGGTSTGALTERADITTGVTLAAGVQGDLLFAGLGEAGSFVQVTTNVPAWVRFYPTSGLRAGDVTRQIDEDPAPGSGVLLELRTQTANETLVITPGAIYYNNDTLPDQALYCRVQNQGDTTALVNVTVRAFTQTDTDTISGGTFGSG